MSLSTAAVQVALPAFLRCGDPAGLAAGSAGVLEKHLDVIVGHAVDQKNELITVGGYDPTSRDGTVERSERGEGSRRGSDVVPRAFGRPEPSTIPMNSGAQGFSPGVPVDDDLNLRQLRALDQLKACSERHRLDC